MASVDDEGDGSGVTDTTRRTTAGGATRTDSSAGEGARADAATDAPAESAPGGEGADSYMITHRGGTRVEVGRPIHLPNAREPNHPWLCTVKLLGPVGPDEDHEATQTILLRSGRGRTAEEAQRVALSRLSLVYGTPSDPPPQVVIRKLSSIPPPPVVTEPAPETGVRGFWKKIGRALGLA